MFVCMVVIFRRHKVSRLLGEIKCPNPSKADLLRETDGLDRGGLGKHQYQVYATLAGFLEKMIDDGKPPEECCAFVTPCSSFRICFTVSFGDALC